jgi:predicted acyl esterase
VSLWRAPAQRLLALPPSRVRVTSSVEWPAMRDGVRLATRCVRPSGPARGTLLVRGADAVHAPRQPLPWLAARLAEQGLVVVLQECRGLHASEGALAPFVQEAGDGADTIAWLAEQGFFAPPLSLAGAGYGGYAAWAALGASPLPVATLLVAHAARDPYAWLHSGGALRLGDTFALAFALAATERGAKLAPDLARAMRHRPLSEADRVGARRLDWLRDWVARPARDAAWDALVPPLPSALPRALLLARWDDSSLDAQRADAEALRGAGADASLEIAAARPVNRARGMLEGLHELRRAAAFVIARAQAPLPPLRAWDGGAERWIEPAPDAVEERRFHLRTDARLDTAAPGPGEGSDRYVYDPADATPSDATRSLRGDVLSYTSEALSSPLALAGRVRAELHAATSAPATDFCVDLLAQEPDGDTHVLAQGIARCRFESADAARVRRIEVDCGAAYFRLAAGWRLCVEVASASHPRFDRAINTREEPALAAADAGAPAVQTVFHDAQRPSCIAVETRS